MEYLTALILIFLVAAMAKPKKSRKYTKGLKRATASVRKTPARTVAVREKKPDEYSFLYDHWEALKEGDQNLPAWYHDPATERQMQRLEEDDIAIPGRPLTKGQASDLIGLGMPPEPEQLEILKFFKVKGLPLRHESIARIEIDRLFKDESRRDEWNNRPATSIQKEFYRWFGFKIPKGLTATQAAEFIDSQDLNEKQIDEWDAYKDILEELSDKEFRDDYDIKKPSMPLIRKAVEQLLEEGSQLENLTADDLIDPLLELNPDLEKN